MNPYRRLRNLLPKPPLDVGVVQAVHADGVTVELLTGGTLRVRGAAKAGARAYVRDGVIEGPAPDLAGMEIEI